MKHEQEKLLRLLSDIMGFAEHDGDCHINNWGDNQIPECTCGYTSVSRDCLAALESHSRTAKPDTATDSVMAAPEV